MMQCLGRRYVQYFNKRYQRTGTLWEGRFKSSLVDSDGYLLRCYVYIELNPVRANLVTNAEAYLWSSVGANAYGKPSPLVVPHPNYTHLGKNKRQRLRAYQTLLHQEISEKQLSSIRAHINQGKVLGTPDFQRQIENLLSRRVGLSRVGRPKKRNRAD